MKLSIVISEKMVDEEVFEVAKENLESIRKYTSVPYELVLIDNASPMKRGWLKEQADILIRNEADKGCSERWTQGLRATTGDILCLMDNDVFVTEGWVEPLLKALKEDNVGIAMPVGKCLEDPYPAGNHAKFRDDTHFLHRLSGFCFLFRRDVYEAVGDPDAENFPVANFEDDDYFRRTMDSGYSILSIFSSRVYHVGRATNRKMPEINKVFKKHRANYVAKHGNRWPEFTKVE